MTLRQYLKKRSPDSTPEPFGGSAQESKLHFVVQKHAASHLHYDFRLQINGVLKSWAIPKGPSLNPSEKHLAILVEDHPYDYLHFEGIIPEGNYGAGTVMVWDKGFYTPLNKDKQPISEKDFLEECKKGKIFFHLSGQKLKGLFSLVRMKGDSAKENWLFIKTKDEYASNENILELDTSALSGKTMNEIGETTEINPDSKNKKKSKKVKKNEMLGSTKIRPMLATLIDEPFDNKEWLFETKWDGYRAIAEINYDKVELYSRNFLSFNTRFKALLDPLANLGVQTILDGEIVILKEDQRTSFQDLQNYEKTGKGNLCYCIFDLLYFEGYDVRELPLIERKKLLKKLLSDSHSSSLKYSDHVLGKGIKAFNEAKKEGKEGIIAKKVDSHYVSTRSRDWLKIKIHMQQEVVICGFTEPRGSRKAFGALVVGVYRENKLEFAGHVGGGFNENTLSEMHQKLIPLVIKKCPFEVIQKTNTPVVWVKPKLVCEVSFQEWTMDNQLRQPIFQGLRIDKDPTEVKKEVPIQEEAAIKNENINKTVPKPILTNLEKIYWPKEGYSKGMLIDYYRDIADYILPYLKDRPESLHRFPNGIEKPGFFQKNVDNSFPTWIPTCSVEHNGETRRYMMIQDIDSLLFAVNLGCIDFNPFSSRIKNLNNPDFIIFDLDPEDISFDAVRQTALVLHNILDNYKIPNFCKTSGATGIHVLVPTGGKYNYEQVKLFAELISALTHNELPDITSMERSPKKRQKKVYLDYLQNNFGQTIACPYSIRPLPLAPVSTPLEWSEVKEQFLPTDFTIKNMKKRLAKKGDILKPLFKQSIDLNKILQHLKK